MTDYEKAYKITIKQIDGNIKNLRYVPMAIQGLCAMIVENYGVTWSNDVVNGVKDAIFDFVCDYLGGVEATFTDEETYNWWNNMTIDSFYAPETRWKAFDFIEVPKSPIFE